MNKKFLKIKIILPLFLLLAVSQGAYSFYQHNLSKHKIVLYGNVEIKEVDVAFRVSGRLKTLAVDEGQWVKKGDLLASIDNDILTNELELAKSNFAATKAKLENAQKKLIRTTELFNNDSASKQQFEDDKFALIELKNILESDKARVKIATIALNDSNIYSPADAFVMTRAFEAGSMISQNQTIYNLSLNKQAFVRAYLSEKDLGRIIDGMVVKIKTDSETQYQGQIGFVSSKAEFTPKSVETSDLRTDLVYRVRINIKNPDFKLKQGMPVSVEIDL